MHGVEEGKRRRGGGGGGEGRGWHVMTAEHSRLKSRNKVNSPQKPQVHIVTVAVTILKHISN